MKEVILIIKLFQKLYQKRNDVTANDQSLNEFLNVKDIKGSILYTLDGHVIQFIKVEPINI